MAVQTSGVHRVSLLAAMLGFACAAMVWADQTPSSRPAPQGPFERAMIIPIHKEITDISKESMDRRIRLVKDRGVPLVIFELDTPGGALGATLDMCSAIKALRDSGVRTVAWVNKEAYSAGTIIALATDTIVMSPNATMGDCKPIMMGPEGSPAALPVDLEAKATSPLLAELRDSVRRNGYDWNLVLALIRDRAQPFWLVNTETGEKRFVDPAERDELFGLTGASSRPSESGVARRVPDSQSQTPWRYVKSAPGLDRVSQPIVLDRELLTMRTVEAMAYGFADASVANQAELANYLNIEGRVDRLDPTWFESVIVWLASPSVRAVLLVLMLLGAYAEFQHPGISFPGIVAAVCLLLFVVPSYLAGFTVPWEIVAIVVGIGLLAIEIFVFPGFGIAGIAGMLLLVLGMIASFVPQEPGYGDWPHWPQFQLSYDYLRRGLWAMAGGLAGATIGMVLLARYMPRVPVAGRMILANPTRDQITVDDPYPGAAQPGDIGKTEGPLRPAGKARFGALLVDVVSDGEYIGKDVRIEVIERSGSRVVVRRVD